MLIHGAGIAGLATALRLRQLGLPAQAIHLLDQAEAPPSTGAGIQLGPNAVSVLAALGLKDLLSALCCRPQQVRVLRTHQSLNRPLAIAPTQAWTCLRADLSDALLGALGAQGVAPAWGQSLSEAELRETAQGRVLIGADGVGGMSRQVFFPQRKTAPRSALALRALVPQAALDAEPGPLAASLRSALQQAICVWFGPGQHVVAYSVFQAGTPMINLVVCLSPWKSPEATPETPWPDQPSPTGVSEELALLLGLAPRYSRWSLSDGARVRSADDLARGSVALVGDAAHPMKPHLAQGAAMALEDAWVLAQQLAPAALHADWQQQCEALKAYAQARAARVAMVQAKAARNGRLFQLRGLPAWGRDLALRALGPRLMASPAVHDWRAEPTEEPLTRLD